MKAIEFNTKISSLDVINIRKKFENEFKKNQKIRVMILVDDKLPNKKSKDLKQIELKKFFDSYGDVDSEYDNL